MKYIRRDYPYNERETREEIVVEEGVAWLLVIIGGGNGHQIISVSAGESWREGWDELAGVFSSEEEAEAALSKIYS